MHNQEENNAGGADEAPNFAGVEGFVDEDVEEDAPDAHAQDAQPVEVEIPNTYQWGVVAAQLDSWQYKSSEKLVLEKLIKYMHPSTAPRGPESRR